MLKGGTRRSEDLWNEGREQLARFIRQEIEQRDGEDLLRANLRKLLEGQLPNALLHDNQAASATLEEIGSTSFARIFGLPAHRDDFVSHPSASSRI